MGQQSKKNYAQQARERREQMEKERREKSRRQNRIFLGIAGGVLAVILIVVGIVFAIRPKTQPTDDSTVHAPTMEEIDFSPLTGDLAETYTATEEPTDLVRMTISYTTTEGEKQQGDIYIRLFPDVAPITVQNFQSLVGSGFYNGTTFHRVYPGFMIQGGAPSDGGNSGSSIKAEFSANGVENNLSHKRGVLSMARTNDPNSATSQFFIVHSDSAKSSLDGRYASFGYVVNGMEVVDAITEIELVYNAGGIDNVATSPVYPVTIESAVFVAKK